MTADVKNLGSALTDFIVSELASNKGVAELSPDDNLLEESLVDSLGIMRLISFIEKEFGCAIPSEDVVVENFVTVNAIIGYLTPKLQENVD